VIFSLKDQINQSLKDILLAVLLLQPRPNVQGCRTFVPNLYIDEVLRWIKNIKLKNYKI
tara:strand:+ start:608 stop:784 length:177 start_codon:yes stop_codon:yes gene_type:complete